MSRVREYTLKLMRAMDEGGIPTQVVADMCLAYMSEDDVKDMCEYNDVFQDEDENGQED